LKFAPRGLLNSWVSMSVRRAPRRGTLSPSPSNGRINGCDRESGAIGPPGVIVESAIKCTISLIPTPTAACNTPRITDHLCRTFEICSYVAPL
jgi:hypothetical protein